MSIDWEKEYGTVKSKKSKINWEKEYNGVEYQKNIDTQRQERISKGLPVSVNKEKVAPTMGGTILRDTLRLGADVLTNAIYAGDVITGRKSNDAPLSNNYLGKVEGLGKVDITKSPLAPENLKTIKKSVGTGAEIASLLTYGGAAKGVTADLFKQGVKQFAKTQGVKLLKEGAGTGLAYSLGSQLSKNADEGTPLSLKQTLIDTGLSTVLTPVAAFGLNRILGKRLPEILRNGEINNLLKKDNWAIITATRERVGDYTKSININANKRLEEELVGIYGRKNVVKVEGKYLGVNQGDSFFVNGIDEPTAQMFGKKYGQDTILTKKGFLASDNSFIDEATGLKVGKEALDQPGYSTLPTGETIAVDIGKRTEIPQQAIEMPGKVDTPIPKIETLQIPKQIIDQPIIESPKIETPTRTTPGYVKMSKSFDKMVAEKSLHPEDANILKTIFEETDDDLLKQIDFESNGKIRRSGNSKIVKNRYTNYLLSVKATIKKGMAGFDQVGFWGSPDVEPSVVLLHEYGHIAHHIVLDDTERQIVKDVFNSLSKKQRTELFEKGLSKAKNKVSDGSSYYAKNEKEFLVQSFAEYIMQNKVPSEKMRPLLQRLAIQFRDALLKLVQRKEINAVKRLKPIFDKMLSGDKNAPLSSFNKSSSFKKDIKNLLLGKETKITKEVPVQDFIKNIPKEQVEQKVKLKIDIPEEEFAKATEVMKKNIDESEWHPTTLKQQYTRFKELLTTNPDKLKKLALNASEIDEGGMRNNWALSFLENEAQKNGDIQLSKELSYSKVGSKAGGELVGGRFKDKDTVASIIREIRKARAKAVGISDSALEKQEKELFSRLKNSIKNSSDEVISSLIC